MKLKLLSIALIACVSFSFAQQKNSFWSTSTRLSSATLLESKMQLPEKNVFSLDMNGMKNALSNAPSRFTNRESNVILSFPNADGKLEQFRIYENLLMEADLAERFPEIKSYIGIGIDNPTSSVYFSISPLGFKSMQLNAGKSAVFIEPLTADLTTYSVYRKADKARNFTRFECAVIDDVAAQIDPSTLRPNADDGMLRTFRLAMSCTGEYAVYFGGSKALALAAINNTMTRVNGVFEKDFGVRMVLISNTDAVIYTNASTDPYSAASSMSSWNAQLQSTLTSVIGEANYDVGHLFGASGGGGNAGCIGCVCVNGSKGSGITSPADGVPMGDNFDIDYVAHELGHQFGANHTFSMSNEGTGVNVEPGSGSTIMGYAGITSQDIQLHSDALFHAASIQQVTNNIKTKTCQTNTATGNAVPTANAGLDYTIPKSTPFMLTGVATDANGDALTYIWEQMDNAASNATGANSAATATRTSGPTFRSYNVSTSPERYFPRMQSVLTGATTTAGSEINVEALSSVARTLNFRFTVRDNRASGPANNSDDAIITVNATAGPFTVSSPNTAVSYVGGSSQTITWAVAGTTANGVNCANVDILLSTNGGTTWSTLLAATPNDGTQAVTIPNTASTTCRIMVKGTNHVFFDVSNTNFTITTGSAPDTQAPTAPTLSASGTTQTTTNLVWSGATDNIGVTGYDVYRGTTLLGSTTSSTYAVTGLSASTTYSFTVRAKDAAGNVSVASNAVSVTTSATADTTAPTAPTLTASGTTQTTTNLSWSGATDNVGVTGYDVYQGATLLSSTASSTYAVSGLTPSTTFTFSVRAKDAAGNISVASNVVSVTTLAVVATYCSSQGNSIADERIGRVQFNTIDNSSGATSGYTDYTAISTNVTTGASYTITVTTTMTATNYSEGYAVWIDYNNDKDFDDAGELVWSNPTSTANPVSGSFTIPSNATLGATRMRVSMKYNGVPSQCETFPYGEVEDYTVNITQPIVDTTPPSVPTNLTASGTTQTTTNLSWNASTDNVGVTGYDVYSGSTLLGNVATTTANITGLIASTTYSFSVRAVDAAGNVSSSSNVVSVTTLAAPDTQAPNAPTNLTASGTTQTTTNLSWNASIDNVGVTGYDVYQGATLISSTVSTSFAVSGLTASTTYSFTVRAFDAAGNVSSSSNVVSVTTQDTPDTQAPNAPTNLIASGTTQTTTNLSWNASIDNVGVTGYDLYQGATLISSTVSTSFAVSGLTASTTYSFTVRAFDAAGNVSVTSNTVSVTTLAIVATYCASQGNNINDERIGRVQFNTIDNFSNAASGYTDYTSISTNVNTGVNYTITITPFWTSNIYSEGYAVWIDYNNDKDFDDAGELVWSNPASTTSPVSGSFTIPSNATLGETRMRVSMKYNGVPSQCETFSYGEVEDYIVNITQPIVDTTPPSVPTNLTASGTTQTTTTLNWNASTDNVGVTGYDVYSGSTLLGNVAATTANITGLIASSTYSFSVRAVDSAGNVSSSSNTVSVTTLGNAVTYCTSQGNSTVDEYINRVQLGTINNTSGNNGGYVNFTNLSTNLVRGTSNTVTITPGWSGNSYNEAYAVWIDYNQDGDFLDSGEQVYSRSRTKTSPVSGSFTVPTSALLGVTRMRVAMKYNANPTSCETFSYGEVEDYTINITSTSRNTFDEETTSFTIYPNPVKGDVLYISESDFTSFRIVNLLGQEVSKGTIENGTISVSTIPVGTYLIEVSNAESFGIKKFIKQ